MFASPLHAFAVGRFEICVDIYFYCDLYLCFRTAYYTAAGVLEINLATIRSNYLRGWFVVDVTSCLPISYITLLVSALQGDEPGATAFHPPLPAVPHRSTPSPIVVWLLMFDATLCITIGTGGGSSLKGFKILRLLRLAKLLRIARLKKLCVSVQP